MPASARASILHPHLPHVRCPRCGDYMRFAKLEPHPAPDRRDIVCFDCTCGFEYQHWTHRDDLQGL